MSRARVGVVSVWHETNTYSARRASLSDFADYELLVGEAIVAHHRGAKSVVGGFLDGTVEDEIVPIFTAGAWPAGPADEQTFAELMTRLRRGLRDAGQLDGVLLNLHGAMVAEGEPDVEQVVVRAIRDLAGSIPIAAVLDLHGNPSPQFVAATDIVIGYNTYPHVDMWECGVEAAGLLHQALDGTQFCTQIAKVPALTCPLAQGTDDEPMRGLLAEARERGAEAGVRRTSVLPGFAYSDVRRAGISVLVVDEATRRTAANRVAKEIASRISAVFAAGGFAVERPAPERAVHMALEQPRPVVLADVADNIGGGSAGDGTVLLAELLRVGARGAVVVIADAEAAALAHSAGVGARITTAVGGKTDHLHGAPVPIDGTITQVSDGRYTSGGSWGTGLTFSMGRTAVVDTGAVTVVLTERATPPFHREHLTSVGIDPAEASILVAKGAIAWRAAYGDVARSVIEVDTPGACPIDPWSLPRSSEPAGWPVA